MIASLLQSLDGSRAAEFIDFLVLFLLLVIAALAALLAVAARRSRLLHRELTRSSEEVYYSLLPTMALNAEDHALIKRLAAFLVYPQQRQRIVTNPQVFEECAQRLAAQDVEAQGPVAALRTKLGFREDHGGELPSSTMELPVGLPIVLATMGRAQTRAGIVRNSGEGLLVQLEAGRGAGVSLSGVPLTAYCQNRAGLFSFVTEVEREAGPEVLLRHSGEIKRYLRRESVRKRLILPVAVRAPTKGESPSRTELIDLSAGGAALRNPDSRFEARDRIELSFAVDEDRFTLPARVLRTSRSGAVIHVRFEGVPAATRERIVELLRRTRTP